mmetsp:Transcript_65935/g.109997  ORF Transcript_65935/g.109997 Transcript_65935/m.109997 type:complete len:208 (-) Transcript_65935:1040-1663(-)
MSAWDSSLWDWTFLTRASTASTSAPTTLPTFIPSLMAMNVGIADTSYLSAVASFRSTSTLTKRASGYFCARSTNLGPMNWQGGHHVAKKSTMTAFSPAPRTTRSNSSSDSTSCTFDGSGVGPLKHFDTSLAVRTDTSLAERHASLSTRSTNPQCCSTHTIRHTSVASKHPVNGPSAVETIRRCRSRSSDPSDDVADCAMWRHAYRLS